MSSKKTHEKKTLETYEDVLTLLNGLEGEIERLGGIDRNRTSKTLRDKKVKILDAIRSELYGRYGVAGSSVNSRSAPRYGVIARNSSDMSGAFHYEFRGGDEDFPTKNLNPRFNVEFFMGDIQANLTDSGDDLPKEYINKTLGTHQNWFKWLLSCFFEAPKSKQFMDGYSIFDAEPTNQEDEGQEPSSESDSKNI